jgi:hypothetical protein
MVGVVRRERPVAAAAVLEVLRWVHLLAWRMAPSRSRASARLVLGLIAGGAVVGATSTLAEQARADAQGLASELTVGPGERRGAGGGAGRALAGPLAGDAAAAECALVLLVSLFLFARLAVAAAELNATLFERRRLERQ